jgi:hypothetical protein
MRWLPYEKWEIRTPLDVLTLTEGLGRYTEPYRFFSALTRWNMWGRSWPPFWGKVDVNGFHLMRRTWYKHSFRPMLSGRFEESPTGTTIRVTMTLHPLVAAFMLFWLGMVGLFGAIGLLAAICSGKWEIGAVCGGMFVFGLGMTYGGYWLEAPRAKRLLVEILAAVERDAAARATLATSP